MIKRIGGALLVLAAAGPLHAQGHVPARTRMTVEQRLPAMAGGSLVVKAVEVTYPPGGASAPHTHPCAVIGYVLEGALRTRLAGQPDAVYRTGESFYEAPGSLHEVSANAGEGGPTRFLAYFLCDRETPLTLPAGGR